MKKGFTLIEVLIVIAIIGLLFAIAIPNLKRAKCSADGNCPPELQINKRNNIITIGKIYCTQKDLDLFRNEASGSYISEYDVKESTVLQRRFETWYKKELGEDFEAVQQEYTPAW